MAQVKLTILVQEAWLDRFPTVVDHCRQAGMRIERQLVTVGVITGTIEQNRVATLNHIEGVSAVEPERVNRGLS